MVMQTVRVDVGSGLDSFILSPLSLINVNSTKGIDFGGLARKYINKTNFMIGQSEVFLTSGGLLEINRTKKKNQLRGNH